MVISIFKFLSRYYGIALDAGCECTHKELKKRFDFLKRCSFDYAESNPYLVGSGKIIYVMDTNNSVIPYFCPNELVESNKECCYTESKMLLEDEKYMLEQLGNIPTYLLGELLNKYKNKPSYYKVIKSELINRGVYENKKYKINKEINKMEIEESEYDDKYKRRRKIKCHKS